MYDKVWAGYLAEPEGAKSVFPKITYLSLKVLGWKSSKSLDDMCRDMWNWQTRKLDGFYAVKK